MPGEYEHVVDPYTTHSSLQQFASNLQLLKPQTAIDHVAVASTPELAAQVERMQHANAANTFSLSTPYLSSASPITWPYIFFSLLLILLVLQTLVWIAQRWYQSRSSSSYSANNSTAADRMRRHGTTAYPPSPSPSTLRDSKDHPLSPAPFSFLSSSSSGGTPAFARFAVAFGFILGVVSMLMLQYLMSPAVVQRTMQINDGAHTMALNSLKEEMHSGGNEAATIKYPTPTVITREVSAPCLAPVCPPIPKQEPCPIPPPAPAPAVCSPSDTACHSLIDLPSDMPPLYQQHSYTSIPIYPIKCHDWASRGKWRVRKEDEPEPYWAKVDRWGFFGVQAQPVHMRAEFIAPDDCVQTTFRKFDPQRFLMQVQGKTIAFVGDSMVRQAYGMLTVLLDNYIRGHSMYYKKEARSLDAVREMYFSSPYNVTLKNQWIPGHNGHDSMIRDTFPTIWRSDLLITNIGAFYHSGMEEQLEETVEYFVKWMKENYKGSWIWREYSPTHFDTPDGEFPADNPHYKGVCKAYDPLAPSSDTVDHFGRFNNFRLTIPKKILSREENQIPIMEIFNSTLIMPDGQNHHPGRGDCRHWYSPSSGLEHWMDVLFNMIVPPDQ